jgi:uncharacterized protein YbjT (DUF2867 family)
VIESRTCFIVTSYEADDLNLPDESGTHDSVLRDLLPGMPRTLLTGATGTLGTALRPRLVEAGHDVLAASTAPPQHAGDSVEWMRLDLVDGTGIDRAVAEADVVVHAATAPQGDTEAVDVRGTERLLAAAEDADVENFLYVSIVGIDEIPYSYYEHKLAAEQAVEASDVPATIVRATQFHQFLDDVLDALSWLPVWPLPTKMQIQPVAVGEVADEIADHAAADASGRVAPVGGPEVLTVGEIATMYRDARGWRRPVVRLPVPGSVTGAFRDGQALCPDRTVGTRSWAAYLDQSNQPSNTTHPGS